MDKFLDKYNQSKFNQEDINHLNSHITCNEIEALIKVLPTKRAQDLMDSWLNFTKPLKRTNTNTPQNFPRNRKGSNTTKLIL
jgi:hypothetical protein